MKNYYDVVSNRITQLPTIKQNIKMVQKLAKPIEFANHSVKYTTYGEKEKTLLPSQESLPFKLVEAYFKKIYKSTFSDFPFFTKIIKTSDKSESKTLKILRTNERGLSTETTVGYDGIRISKLTKQNNPDGSCTYTRFSYNKNGTKPKQAAFWIEDK